MQPDFFAGSAQVEKSHHQFDCSDIDGNAPVPTSLQSKGSDGSIQIPPSWASALEAIIEGALKKMLPLLLASLQKEGATDTVADSTADFAASSNPDPQPTPAAISNRDPQPTLAASSNPDPRPTAATSSIPDPQPTAATRSNTDPVSSSGPTSTAKPGSIAASAIGQWAPQIDAASKASGIAPEVIGAQIWAESRGKQSTNTQNGDGTRDIGLMQIGQERWNRGIVPTLSASDKANIQKATGKDASQLDVTNPADNVVAGAFHLKKYIEKNGGSLDGGLADYVGAGRDSKYVKNVHTFINELANGQPLSQDSGG